MHTHTRGGYTYVSINMYTHVNMRHLKEGQIHLFCLFAAADKKVLQADHVFVVIFWLPYCSASGHSPVRKKTQKTKTKKPACPPHSQESICFEVSDTERLA